MAGTGRHAVEPGCCTAGSCTSPHSLEAPQVSLNRFFRQSSVLASQILPEPQRDESSHQLPLSNLLAPSHEHWTHLWLFGSPSLRWQIVLAGQSPSESQPSTQRSLAQRDPL